VAARLEAIPAPSADKSLVASMVASLRAGAARIKADYKALDDPRLADRLSSEALFRTHRDSRVRASIESWRQCMKTAGFDYTEPVAANDDPAFGTEQPTAAEIKTATADVACKVSSDLLSVMATVETAYQKRALEENAQALEIVKRNREARERNAAAALTAG
jgi:hypothetical protein